MGWAKQSRRWQSVHGSCKTYMEEFGELGKLNISVRAVNLVVGVSARKINDSARKTNGDYGFLTTASPRDANMQPSAFQSPSAHSITSSQWVLNCSRTRLAVWLPATTSGCYSQGSVEQRMACHAQHRQLRTSTNE